MGCGDDWLSRRVDGEPEVQKFRLGYLTSVTPAPLHDRDSHDLPRRLMSLRVLPEDLKFVNFLSVVGFLRLSWEHTEYFGVQVSDREGSLPLVETRIGSRGSTLWSQSGFWT